ncbi:MAG: gamma-glutamyltransferase [Alphaproteobacteria bacterium]|nr:gamma-glutamyltransferase [Alphaproteobacteria bacterium]
MLSKRHLALLAAPALMPLLMLAGCQTIESLGDHTASTLGLGDGTPQSYTASEISQGQRAIAVADEPLAARVGAGVLTSGGNAVDAVAAMFFTMSATYPVAAGLGSGGICLVRDASGQVAEFDFLTKAPRAGGAYALPGSVKGFAEMHRLYGALPWQRVVAPAEAYASTGFPVSQALAVRLAAAQNILRLDASLAGEFLDQSGAPLAAGSETKNVPLGVSLSAIRQNRSEGFYTGDMAARIVAYSASQGGGISAAELAGTTVLQGPARSRGIGSLVAYLPGSRTGAGAFSASMMDNLSRRGANPQGAASQTLAAFGVSAVPHDLGSTGFAAVDVNGGAASCAVTLNGPFGSGRTATGTGVVLGMTPSSQTGLASAFLTPVIAQVGGTVAMAGVGAGGPSGTAAAISAVLSAAGGRTFAKRGDLRGTGTAPYDTVNMISCDENSCVALSDPGAHGAGAAAEVTAAAR